MNGLVVKMPCGAYFLVGEVAMMNFHVEMCDVCGRFK